jgi:hypothetical protein
MKIVDWFMNKDAQTIVNSLLDFPNHAKINEIVEYAKKNCIRIQVRTKDDIMVLGLAPDLVRPAWFKEDMFKFSFKGCRIIANANGSIHSEKFRSWGFVQKGSTFTYQATKQNTPPPPPNQ